MGQTRDSFGSYSVVRRVSMVTVLGIVPKRPLLTSCLKLHMYSKFVSVFILVRVGRQSDQCGAYRLLRLP